MSIRIGKPLWRVYKSFSFIAAIATIAASVITATGITWFSTGVQHAPEVAKSPIDSKNMGVPIPLHNTYESKIVRLSKVSSGISSPSSSRLSQIALQLRAMKTSASSVVIRTQRSNITIFLQLHENETHHIFSTKIKSVTPIKRFITGSNGSGRNTTTASLSAGNTTLTTTLPEHIAFVAPTFTTAAYNDAFYVFYRLNENVPYGVNVTTNISLLTSRVVDVPPRLIKNAYLGLTSNLQVITDEDVNNGLIFRYKNAIGNDTSEPSVNIYDVLILGHQEYVTQKEYDNLKHFVENGGTLILLDGNVFYAQVNYDKYHHAITLVKGHGWTFNDKSAWKSVSERWAKETSQWIGSNFLPCVCPVTFANDPFEYKHHEEQYITNHNDTILTNYDATLVTKQHVSYKPVIATYELHYKKGLVIVLGLYSEDILYNVKFDKYFDTLLMQHTSRQHTISYQK